MVVVFNDTPVLDGQDVEHPLGYEEDAVLTVGQVLVLVFKRHFAARKGGIGNQRFTLHVVRIKCRARQDVQALFA